MTIELASKAQGRIQSDIQGILGSREEGVVRRNAWLIVPPMRTESCRGVARQLVEDFEERLEGEVLEQQIAVVIPKDSLNPLTGTISSRRGNPVVIEQREVKTLEKLHRDPGDKVEFGKVTHRPRILGIGHGVVATQVRPEACLETYAVDESLAVVNIEVKVTVGLKDGSLALNDDSARIVLIEDGDTQVAADP